MLSTLKFIAQEKPDNDQIPTTAPELSEGTWLSSRSAMHLFFISSDAKDQLPGH